MNKIYASFVMMMLAISLEGLRVSDLIESGVMGRGKLGVVVKSFRF